MFSELHDECKGFPYAIGIRNENMQPLTSYNLRMTLVQCQYFGISREIFDGEETALRAIIANDEIEFFVRYMNQGVNIYHPIGKFPAIAPDDARNTARCMRDSYGGDELQEEDGYIDHIDF